MPVVLITGANGFIGSHLCDAFLAAGYTVYGLVRATSDLRFLRGAEVRLLYGDLTALEAIRFPETVEVIVHAAALVSDNATRGQCRRHIYELTVGLAELAARLYPRLRKFVYLSSALTLGYCADNISERNPGRSAAYLPYAAAKKQAEAYLLEKHRSTGFPVVVLRPGDVYGPRDRTSCEHMLQAAEKGVPLVVGSGRKRFGLCSPAEPVQGGPGDAGKTANQRAGLHGREPGRPHLGGVLPGAAGRGGRPPAGLRAGIPVPGRGPGLRAAKLLFPGFRPALNFYRVRRITTQTTYDMSATQRELGYESDDDYRALFDRIVAWYKDKPRNRC